MPVNSLLAEDKILTSPLINLDELVNRGYEDGCHQFVEAVVAESAELIDSPSGEQSYGTDSISERLAAHEHDVDEQAT